MKNNYTKFNNFCNGIKRRNQCKANNRKSVNIIRDIEILKIKLIDLELYLSGKDIYTIIDYLNKISYYSNLENLVIEKPEVEDFWLTIWKYQLHSSENEIIVKIGYKRSTRSYNAMTNYVNNLDIHSNCIYTEINLFVNYLMNYLFPILISKESNYINPINFLT